MTTWRRRGRWWSKGRGGGGGSMHLFPVSSLPDEYDSPVSPPTQLQTGRDVTTQSGSQFPLPVHPTGTGCKNESNFFFVNQISRIWIFQQQIHSTGSRFTSGPKPEVGGERSRKRLKMLPAPSCSPAENNPTDN